MNGNSFPSCVSRIFHEVTSHGAGAEMPETFPLRYLVNRQTTLVVLVNHAGSEIEGKSL
jgi:hypothetical protein